MSRSTPRNSRSTNIHHQQIQDPPRSTTHWQIFKIHQDPPPKSVFAPPPPRTRFWTPRGGGCLTYIHGLHGRARSMIGTSAKITINKHQKTCRAQGDINWKATLVTLDCDAAHAKHMPGQKKHKTSTSYRALRPYGTTNTSDSTGFILSLTPRFSDNICAILRPRFAG